MKRLIAALVCACVLCLGVASIAIADDASDACLECHDVAAPGGSSMKVDFSAASVDYDSCATCHGVNGSNGDHWHQSALCKTCHYTWLPAAAPYTSPQHETPFGYFDNADSVNASPEALHAIHTSGSWVDDYCCSSTGIDPSMGCSKCHAPAACSACHMGSLEHTDHALPDYPAVGYRGATGVSVVTASLTCVNAACHPVADGLPVPACDTCHAETAAEHEAAHDASGVTNTGCRNCHSMDLVAEHASRGLACADCHLDADYAAAIQAGDLSCTACHASPVHRTSRGR